MKKRIVALFLAAAMTVSLTACGGNGGTSTGDSANTAGDTATNQGSTDTNAADAGTTSEGGGKNFICSDWS